MVPVRERDCDLAVDLTQIWKIWVAYYERSSQTVWILSLVMGMVPICTYLACLEINELEILQIRSVILTVKL